MSENSTQYLEPVSVSSGGDDFDVEEFANSVKDLAGDFSLGSLVLWALDAVFGINPGQWVADELTGNYQGIEALSGGYNGLGKFAINESYQRDSDISAIGEAWQGSASDAAISAMNSSTAQLPLVTPVAELVAQGLSAFVDLVKQLVEQICDTVNNVIEYAINALTGLDWPWKKWTKAKEAVQGFQDALDKYSEVIDAVSSFVSEVQGYKNQIDSIKESIEEIKQGIETAQDYLPEPAS